MLNFDMLKLKMRLEFRRIFLLFYRADMRIIRNMHGFNKDYIGVTNNVTKDKFMIH